jgi:hypothetical protein
LDPSAYANGSPVFECRYYERCRARTLTDWSTDLITCSTSHPLLCKVDPTNQLDPIFLLHPFMAPLPRSIDSALIETSTLWTVAENFAKILLLVVFIAVAVKSYTILSLRRNKMLVQQTITLEKDSKSSLAFRPKRSPSRSPSCQPEDQNLRLQALKEELSQPAFKPIHPWIAPPTPLPGPYDAPYYPLPTIRPHSQDSSSGSPPPEEIQCITYSRRVSNTSDSSTEPTVQGTVMVSNHGWRRTQWTVSKG